MSEELSLTSKNVSNIFHDCLFRDGEDHSNMVVIKGIIKDIHFNAKKISLHKEKITTLCNQLYIANPENKHKIGGHNYVNMCKRNDGKCWSDFQEEMVYLLLLGISIGKMDIPNYNGKYCYSATRIPYVTVN